MERLLRHIDNEITMLFAILTSGENTDGLAHRLNTKIYTLNCAVRDIYREDSNRLFYFNTAVHTELARLIAKHEVTHA